MPAMNDMGTRYYMKSREALGDGRPVDALKNLKLAEVNFKRDYNHKMHIRTLNLITITYSILEDDEQMAESIAEGLKYCNIYGLRGAKSMFYNALCDRYMSLGDKENSLKYGKLTVENLENYGQEFDSTPGAYMVAYLNLSYSYLTENDTENAKIYINKAADIAKENDIHMHDYTFLTMNCCIAHKAGDDNFVKSKINDLISIAKDNDITITDYIQDIDLACDLLIDLKLYDKAVVLTEALAKTLSEGDNAQLRLKISKINMRIYNANGDKQKYYEACESYVTDDMAINDAASAHSLSYFNKIIV